MSAGRDIARWTRAVLDGEADKAPPDHARLDHLSAVFGLDRAGHRLVALAYGSWAGDGPYVPLGAVHLRRLAGDAAASLRSRLVGWDILTEVPQSPGAPLALVLDETIGDWLDGGDPFPPRWQDRITLRDPKPPLPHWPVTDLADFAKAAFGGKAPAPRVLRIAGAEGSGRRSLAGAVAEALGTTPIHTDLRGLTEADALALMRLVERAALLALRPPAYTVGEPVHLPDGFPRFALTFEIVPQQAPGLADGRTLVRRVELGPIPHAHREAAWRAICPKYRRWNAADRRRLIDLKAVNPGEIARVTAEGPKDAAAALALLRADQRARLDPVIMPHRGTMGWGDLVLPDRLERTLRRLCAEIDLSPSLWDEPEVDRLYPQGRGVFALFSGPSGTGKTTAAQVIAAALGVDLYVVDAGAITSKYVGETAQNIQAVLSQAEADAALLLFDEADGLFARRTETRDAHARYLNADTNVLLQAVESYRGACILATNRRDNIDSAFLRRVRFACEFPRPDAGLRLRLWQGLTNGLRGSSETAPLMARCAVLAETLEFTGAQIKNALRTAVIEARVHGRANLIPGDLLVGAEQELLKEGRSLTRAEAARLEMAHG
jgi:cytidylate kinase